jgi:hypothetical protein
VRIREIRAVGLRGATPEGGWSEELRPDDVVHTLVAVHTDEGLVGFGSVFTSDELVRGALSVLEPLYEDENALEPERVSEKLHKNTFWHPRGAGSRGSDYPYYKRHRHRPLGPAGQGHGAAGRTPVGRALQGPRPPLRFSLDGRAGGAPGALALAQGTRF